MGRRRRLDSLLVERGLAPTRERAKALVLAGAVEVDGRRDLKPGSPLDLEASIRVVADPNPYVSRGGLKLAHALKAFRLDVTDLLCLDVGASTGGFTDCLLRAGAARVIALDVGKGQLDWSLRTDPRVALLEKKNARELVPADLPGPPDLAVIDVSFISLRLVLPPVASVLKTGGRIVALVKPQFEVGKGEVGRGGLVRDPAEHRRVIRELVEFCRGRDLGVSGLTPSPIRGAKGNVEYFLLIRRTAGGEEPPLGPDAVGRAVAEAVEWHTREETE